MFKKIILSITFSIGFMFACSEGDDLDNSQNESFDRGSLQTNLADNIIIPAYQDLSQQLGLLVSAKENFIANCSPVFHCISLNWARAKNSSLWDR